MSRAQVDAEKQLLVMKMNIAGLSGILQQIQAAKSVFESVEDLMPVYASTSSENATPNIASLHQSKRAYSPLETSALQSSSNMSASLQHANESNFGPALCEPALLEKDCEIVICEDELAPPEYTRAPVGVQGDVVVVDTWFDDADQGYDMQVMHMDRFLSSCGNMVEDETKISEFKQDVIKQEVMEDTEDYETEYDRVFESVEFRVVFERNRTVVSLGGELEPGVVIAGRYKYVSPLGEAAFSQVFKCVDLRHQTCVSVKMMKIIDGAEDSFRQEVRMLKLLNEQGDADENHVLRLLDAFIYANRMFIVTECLSDNLYEYQRYLNEIQSDFYFHEENLKRIAKQTLMALRFVHSMGMVHCDVKPENILIKSASKCDVKLIDFGLASFLHDPPSFYTQSRYYRAPEVILGLKYDGKIDVWSLGCVLAEQYTEQVLFLSDSTPKLLAKIVAVAGSIPSWMVRDGAEADRFFHNGMLYEPIQGEDEQDEYVQVLYPKPTSLAHRCRSQDKNFISFLSYLLQIDPHLRPTAEEALRHPWLAGDRPEENVFQVEEDEFRDDEEVVA